MQRSTVRCLKHTLVLTAFIASSLQAAVEISGVQGTLLGRDDGIVMVNIQTKAKTKIIPKDTLNRYNGGYTDWMGAVRFSPDGQRIVFWANWWLSDWSAKAPGAMYVADNNGRNITKLCDAHVDHADLDYQSLSWCTDGYIYFSRQTDTILRVNPNTRVVENFWSAVGVPGYKTDGASYGPYVENLVVSRDGTKGVSSNGGKVHGLNLTTKTLIRSCGGGCRGAITTNGDQIVHWLTCCGYYPPGYDGTGSFLKVTALQSMGNCDDVQYMFAPGSASGQNPSALQYWMYRGACNSNDYLAGCGYGNDNGVLQNKNTSDYLVIPNYVATDFYLGALPAPPSPTPRIALDSTALNFVSTGGANPASKVVRVTNSGTSTLTNVTATESASWLTVTRGGSGNSQTLTNAVNVSGLTGGVHTTTVTVSGGGASNTESYTVTLSVGSAVAAPTTLAASPGTARLSASLLWQDNATNEAGYVVQRQDSGATTWTTVKSLAANAASWTDTGLIARTYNYRVRAYLASDSSAWSNVASVRIAPVITITVTSPTAGQTLAASSTATVRWTATNSSGVYLEWTSDAGDTWTPCPLNGFIRPTDTNWGAYQWAVPNVTSTECMVAVIEYADHGVRTESALFSIGATSVLSGASMVRGARRAPQTLFDIQGRVVSRNVVPRKAVAVRNCGQFGVLIGSSSVVK